MIFSADLHLHLHFVLCLFTLTETLWEIAKQTIGRSNKPFSIILNRYFMQWEFILFLFLTFILLVCGRIRDGAYNAFECDRPNERTTIHGIWFMNQFQTIFHNEKNESNNLSEFPLTFFNYIENKRNIKQCEIEIAHGYAWWLRVARVDCLCAANIVQM